MLIDRFPQLLKLTQAEQLQLAEELEQQALAGLSPSQEDELETIVQERWKSYTSDPSSGVSLDTVRARLKGK